MNKDQLRAAHACLRAILMSSGGAVVEPDGSMHVASCVAILLLVSGFDMMQVRNILRVPTWESKHPHDLGFYLDEEVIQGNWVATTEVSESEVVTALRSRCSDFIGA